MSPDWRTQLPGGELRLSPADLSFRLSPEDRARIRSALDPDAIERLLANIVPVAREHLLENFVWRKPPAPDEPVVLSLLSSFGDPVLNELLQEAWAPFWEENAAYLDDAGMTYPGRELALRRRRERAERGETPGGAG